MARIINNTQDHAFYCALVGANSNKLAIALGGLGVYCGFAGLLVTGLPTPLGVVAGVAGTIVGVGGLVDTLTPTAANRPEGSLLLPQRRMSTAASTSDLTLIDLSIDSQNNRLLVVRMASASVSGDTNIESIGMGAQPIFKLDLGSARRSEPRALATIAGIHILHPSSTQELAPGSNLADHESGIVFSRESSNANLRVFDTRGGRTPTFEIKPDSAVAFVESLIPPDSPTSIQSVLTLESDPIALVWRLENYRASGANGDNLGVARSEPDMKSIANEKRTNASGESYLAYTWGGGINSNVIGYTKANASVQLLHEETNPTSIAYLTVTSEQPFLKLI